jgi:hypothetical protein
MANLISKSEYKNYMGIVSSTKDTEIDLLIPKVSELIKSYCRRTFIDYYSSPQTEFFDGNNYTELILKESPVVTILSVSKSTDYGQNYSTVLTQYVDWVQIGDSIRAISNNGCFPYLLRGYKVEYFGGYDTVPEDLKLAALDLVEYYSKNNSAVHVNRDVTPNVTQIQYVASTNFPAHIKRVLDMYVADYA